MEIRNAKILKILGFCFFVVCFLFLSNFSFALSEPEQNCIDSCPSGSSCSFLPKCKTGCDAGCQVGYYLSDGDGDHTNNCLTVDGSGRCTKSNVKGVCEICPPGFYCKGGMKDKIPCPVGKYAEAPGSASSSDCKTPGGEGSGEGYCVAKAKLVGTGTISIPSVCIETPLGVLSNNSIDSPDVDIPGAINSQMGNDVGIKGYTENNKLGANISIPCPLGTYSTAGGSKCLYPSKGYCASIDGVNCVSADANKNPGNGDRPYGGRQLQVPMDSTDLKAAIVASIGLDATHTFLGATKQALCPLGTYDIRTRFGKDYNQPAPFCIYPDVGYATGNTAGSFTQTPCPLGQYDIRWKDPSSPSYSNGVFIPYSESPDSFLVEQPNASCVACPAGTFQPITGKAYCVYPEAGSCVGVGCNTGTISAATGQSTTIQCARGYYDSRTAEQLANDVNFVGITDIAIGKDDSILRHNSGYISSYCRACPRGTYQPEIGKTYCITPDVGTYQDAAGQSTVKSCPVGTFDARNSYSGNITWTYGASYSVAGTTFTAANDALDVYAGKTAGKINYNSCVPCPVGTYQDEVEQAACKNPEKLNCSSMNGSSCSEDVVGAITQIDCKNAGYGAYYYDYRNQNITKTNKNCSKCTEDDYTAWQLITCQAGNTFFATRSTTQMANWNECKDTSKTTFGHCTFCNSHSDCGIKTSCGGERLYNDCGEKNDWPGCSYGFNDRSGEHWYDTTWGRRTKCCSDCYKECDSGDLKFCTASGKRCDDEFYLKDSIFCYHCPTVSGPAHTLLKPGTDCSFKCNNGGYYPSGNSCAACPVIPNGSTWANPGVDCSWKCVAGYVKNPNGLSCDSCNYASVGGYCVWNSPGINCYLNNVCSFSCNYGFSVAVSDPYLYYCLSCGNLPTGASSWTAPGSCAVNCKAGYKPSSDGMSCVPCESDGVSGWLNPGNCKVSGCNGGYIVSVGRCKTDIHTGQCASYCYGGECVEHPDGESCTSCGYFSGSYWTNPGLSCSYSCIGGYMYGVFSTGDGNSAYMCGYCGAAPVGSIGWHNPGVDCTVSCSNGYSGSGTLSCTSCGNLPLNATGWVNPGVTCDIACSAGYTAYNNYWYHVCNKN